MRLGRQGDHRQQSTTFLAVDSVGARDVNRRSRRSEPALDCLRLEIDTNWTRDRSGRLLAERIPEPVQGSAPYLLWAGAPEGTVLELGSEIPERTAERLLEIYRRKGGVSGPGDPPPGAEEYRKVVKEDIGSSVVTSVPCFVIDEVPVYPLSAVWEQRAEIVRSNDGVQPRRSPAMPPENIDERRGPWAGVVVNGELVSHCSTARSWEHGAEAGTWTDPAHRGQGFAAAATAAWASLLLSEERVLFYCTDDWNRSSRAVAERLDLRPIGWMWRLDPPGS